MKLVARTVSPGREPKKIAKQSPKASVGFWKIVVPTPCEMSSPLTGTVLIYYKTARLL
jgi:hypothetical protein